MGRNWVPVDSVEDWNIIKRFNRVTIALDRRALEYLAQGQKLDFSTVRRLKQEYPMIRTK